MRRTLVALLAFATSACAAEAVPASPEEAQRLTTLFEAYVGHPAPGKPGTVKVVPHGETYTLTLDVTRLLGFLSATGVDVVAGDFVAELTPTPDGLWHVTVDGFPPVGLSEGDHAFSFTISNYAFDGLFDPKIQAFAQSTTTTHGSSTHVRNKEQPVDIRLTDTGAGTTKATDAGAGTVTSTTTGTYKDLDYRISTPPKDGQAAGDDSEIGHLTAAGLSAAITADHAPIVAINDLWRFLVDHPSKPALIAAQADFKTRLKAIVPLASATTADIGFSQLAVDTHFGTFGLGSFDLHQHSAEGDSKGSSTTRLAFAGLALPADLAPTWAVPLVPASFDITQTYGPINTTPALQMAIDDFDLAADKPLTDDQQSAILKALNPDDMTLTIAPSSLATPTLKLGFQGDVHVRKPLPTGAGKVTAAGLDKTIEAVRAAGPNDPNATTAITVLMAAKALAKAEGPDSYSWDIVAPLGGDVTVNGNSLSTMMQQGGKPRGNKPRKTSTAP